MKLGVMVYSEPFAKKSAAEVDDDGLSLLRPFCFCLFPFLSLYKGVLCARVCVYNRCATTVRNDITYAIHLFFFLFFLLPLDGTRIYI